LSFASSSTLARQIENGAAADIFLSADEEWMAYLDERHLVAAGTWVRPVGNRLVMVAPADRSRSVELERGFDLLAILGDGRLSTGDPAHVPAGRYGRQALEFFGVWNVAEPRLARAENVRAALALVERGEAPLGIVYLTDARASKAVRVVAEFPEASHEPIRYSFAILSGRDRADVRELLAHLTSPAGLAVFRAHGFVTY
jgi:molybdate transport system substrate-binding protein